MCTGEAHHQEADEPRNTDSSAPSALVDAARKGDSEAVWRLLQEGAFLEERDEEDNTCLLAAALGNHWHLVKQLAKLAELLVGHLKCFEAWLLHWCVRGVVAPKLLPLLLIYVSSKPSAVRFTLMLFYGALLLRASRLHLHQERQRPECLSPRRGAGQPKSAGLSAGPAA